MSFTISSDNTGSTYNGPVYATTSGNMTWSSAASSTYYIAPEQCRATLVLDDVPVTRAFRTEVDRLLAEVDEVCALAR